MKKGSKILKVSVFIVSLFIGMYGVLADTLTYTVSTESGSHAIKQGTCSGTCSGFSGTLDFFCLDGSGVTQGIVGATASEKTIALDNFIVAKVLKDKGITESSGLIASSNHDLYSQIEEALYVRASSDEATRWFNTYNAYKSGFNPSLSALSQFTLSGTNYTATTTISNLGDYANITCSSSVGTATISGTTVTVKVPKASITDDTTVNLTCNASYEYYMSQVFNGQDGSQDLAIKPKKYSGSKSLTKSGNIQVDKKGSITLTKKGKNSKGETKKLQGVKFEIKNSRGNTINASGREEANYKFTTDANGQIKVTDIEISNTAAENIYTIREVSTISGYVIFETPIEVNLNELSDRSYAFTKTITNDTVKVTISKTDATGKK